MHQTPQRTRHDDAASDHAALLDQPSQTSSADATDLGGTAGGDGGADEPGGNTLDDAARDEKEYVRERLRGELGREPSEEELSEWLRQHTEGY